MATITTIPDGDTNWGAAMRANLVALNDELITKYVKPATGITSADLETSVQSALDKANSAVQPAGLTKAAVGLGNVDNTSDANKPVSTAQATAINAKYTKPSTGIPKTDLDSSVAASLSKADSALQSAPVTSVASKTGDVSLVKADVGLANVDNTADANKPVSTAQATAINAKYTKPSTGIPASDLASAVQTSLSKADSAVQPAALSAYIKTINGTGPDANGNVVVSGGGTAPVTSVAGRTGDVTLTKSDVGLSNVDNTSDVNKPVSTAQSAAIAAGGATNLLNQAKVVLNGTPMIAYGHSFVVGSGVNSPNKYTEKLAAMYGMVFPTSVGSSTTGDLMRAVGGSRVEECVQRFWSGLPTSSSNTVPFQWTIGTKAPVVIEALINTSRTTGQNAAALAGAMNAYRTMCAGIGADGYIPATSTRFTYSSGWTTATINVSRSGTVYSVPSGGATTVNVQFSAPAEVFYVIVLARNASIAGHTVLIENATNGTTIATVNNTNQSASDTPSTYVPMPIRVRAATGDTIKISRSAGTGPLSFDGILVPGDNPPPIMLVKEPYLKDYSLSTSYPNGSDAVFDYFNTVIDQMASEFSNVVSVDLNAGGYWDKNTMIQSDGVHPNDSGAQAIANTIRDSLNAQLPRNMARKAMGLFNF